MKNKNLKKILAYNVACVSEFANSHNLTLKDSFNFLYNFKGLDFLEENYEAEHLLPFDTVIEDLEIICKKNGGIL